jgi:predicted nucleic acid-binding protein
MSVVVLDTDVVSFRFKKDTRARLYKRHLIGQDPLIAFMTLAELHAWARERRWGAARQGELARHLGQYEVYYVDDALCRLWAEVWTRARRKGRPIEVADGWIAATALALDVPLLTHNPTDFAAVDGLTVLSAEPDGAS